MNLEKQILDQLDAIDIATIEARERMQKGERRRQDLQNSFDRAVINPENVDTAGVVNWNFVDSDMHLDGQGANGGEFSTMVWRWEQKEATRLEIARRNNDAKLDAIETGFFK